MLAPYVVIPLAGYPFAERLPAIAQWLGQGAGWRMAFLLTGFAGLVWLAPWLSLYREPRESRLLGAKELEIITAPAAGDEATTAAGEPWSWGRILSSRIVWLLLLGRMITDPAWYFYQFWFPKYLNTGRHLAQEQLTVTWIVYAAAGAGSLVGGWLSGRLVKRGAAPAASRLWVMLGCACLMPLSPLIARVAGLNMALTLTVVAVFAALAWLINISSLVVDLVPKHSLGTVFSVVAAGSTVGGILMNTIVATMVAGPVTKPGGFLDQGVRALLGPVLRAVEGGGYEQWFLVMAFLHPIAWLMLWGGKIHRGGKA
jgi:MFS transporter, ACS family, hexuronate transporter